MQSNRLGIFVKSPVVGRVKTRLCPPLSPEQARDLYLAFLQDLISRIQSLRLAPTVFLAGEATRETSRLLADPARVEPQVGDTLGQRLHHAFGRLLRSPGDRAVIIGSDSPDLPAATLRRAFRKLKHRDVVLGPATDGGYYLIGLRAPAPALFDGIAWSGPEVLGQTVRAVERAGLTLSLLPVWYDVDDDASLHILESMCRARRLAGGVRLPRTERILETLARRDR